ncbi:MAG: ABC transporter permease [Mycetocola sp.]
MNALRFWAARLGGTLAVLLVVVISTFAIFQWLPADPALMSCGKPCTAENYAAARHFLGIDEPVITQIWNYLRGIFAGRTFGTGSGAIDCPAPCLGYSFQLNRPVTDLILSRFPVTASITIGAAILWLAFGIIGGSIAALHAGRGPDRTVTVITTLGVSMPIYLVGMLAILVFGFGLGWLPTGGYQPFVEDPVGWFSHLLLPWIALAFTNAALYARLTRTELIDQLSSDHIRTARAIGLTETAVVTRHGLRNALLPVVTIFGLDLGILLGGAVIIEKVFSMQGIGSLLISAVGTSDLQVVVGVTLWSAALIVVANLVVDLVYVVIDPRVAIA